jgi:hypothetical protein
VIRDYLDDYAKTLAPPSLSVTTVAERKRQVKEALEAADIGVVSMFEAGSFSHGTGVKDRSDVDLMIWTSFRDRTQLPSSILSRYRRALFMSTNVANATVSNPAVRVEFWSAPVFEVAPAFHEAEDIYEIGGRKDEWVLSSPKAHNLYVNKENDRLGKKVKPLARLVKAWKYYADVPVSSFYLEMRTAEHCSGEKTVLYHYDLIFALNKILAKDVADMNDPSGITGRIPACSSGANRAETKRKMTSALAALREAMDCRNADDRSGYWTNMSKVFGYDFPYPV